MLDIITVEVLCNFLIEYLVDTSPIAHLLCVLLLISFRTENIYIFIVSRVIKLVNLTYILMTGVSKNYYWEALQGRYHTCPFK